jgi:hypothetical protein
MLKILLKSTLFCKNVTEKIPNIYIVKKVSDIPSPAGMALSLVSDI